MRWKVIEMFEYKVKKNFIVNVIFGFANKFLVLFLQFILRTAIIKILGEQYIGLDGLFSSILQFLSLSELGFGTAIVQSMYEPIAKNDDNTVSNILGMYKRFLSVIGLIILIVGIVVTPIVPYLIKDAEYPSEINIYLIYFLYLLNTSVSYGVLAYWGLLFSAHQRNDEITKVNMVINVLKYGIQIVLIVFCRNYYLFVMVFLVMTMMNNLWITIKAKKKFPQYFIGKSQVPCRNEIIKKTKALIGQKLYSVSINSADTITVSFFLGLTFNAIYSNYYYIIQGIINLLDVILFSLMAGIGNRIITKTRQENYEDFVNITFLYNWLITVCTACLLSVFQPFMKVWAGEELLFEENTMILLVAYFYLWKMKDSLSLYKDAQGLWWQDRYRPYVCALLDIILNIILIKKWGINGVFIATIISDVVVSFPWVVNVTFKYYFRDNKLDYYKDILIYMLEAIIVSCITYLVSRHVRCVTYVDVIFLAVLCLTISNMVMLLIHWKTKRFRNIVNKLKMEVRKRYGA